MKDSYYNQKYFRIRDHLDLHIASSIYIFCKEHNLKKVLDVGCGTGLLVKFLNEKGLEAQGCDVEKEAIKFAQKANKKGSIKRCSATKLTYQKNSFDLVTNISVIEHLNKNEAIQFIKQAKKVLDKNGWLFIITPNFQSPLRCLLKDNWFAYSDPTHKYFYTPSSLAKLLTQHGFTNLKTRFKIDPQVTFDWHLPAFSRKFPQPIKILLTWAMISSPLSTFRDSFWLAAQKKK